MSLLGLPVPPSAGEALSRVGAIVEEPRFHGHLTGRENLEIVAAARDREAVARIDAIARAGRASTARADDRVKTYSLGMRQRLGIARCLLADPELLILDEPMNGLDPAGILEFRDLIRAFVDEGRTVVLSSHLLDEVEKTCDHVAIVDRGRVVVQGPIAEIAATATRRCFVEVDDLASGRSVALGGGRSRQDRSQARSAADTCGRSRAGRVNTLLVGAGLAVSRLEPARATLEAAFLSITSRLGSPE